MIGDGADATVTPSVAGGINCDVMNTDIKRWPRERRVVIGLSERAVLERRKVMPCAVWVQWVREEYWE